MDNTELKAKAQTAAAQLMQAINLNDQKMIHSMTTKSFKSKQFNLAMAKREILKIENITIISPTMFDCIYQLKFGGIMRVKFISEKQPYEPDENEPFGFNPLSIR